MKKIYQLALVIYFITLSGCISFSTKISNEVRYIKACGAPLFAKVSTITESGAKYMKSDADKLAFDKYIGLFGFVASPEVDFSFSNASPYFYEEQRLILLLKELSSELNCPITLNPNIANSGTIAITYDVLAADQIENESYSWLNFWVSSLTIFVIPMKENKIRIVYGDISIGNQTEKFNLRHDSLEYFGILMLPLAPFSNYSDAAKTLAQQISFKYCEISKNCETRLR